MLHARGTIIAARQAVRPPMQYPIALIERPGARAVLEPAMRGANIRFETVIGDRLHMRHHRREVGVSGFEPRRRAMEQLGRDAKISLVREPVRHVPDMRIHSESFLENNQSRRAPRPPDARYTPASTCRRQPKASRIRFFRS